MSKKNKTSPSPLSLPELRQDLVSGDWVIIAPGRTKRPRDLIKRGLKRSVLPLHGCPFENLKTSGNWPPVLTLPSVADWRLAVIPNKYPALIPHLPAATLWSSGPYTARPALGYHELIVTSSHRDNFPRLRPADAAAVLTAAQSRYQFFKSQPGLNYGFLFHNWGATAGASVFHPHYQLVALPVLPSDVSRSLVQAGQYFRRHRRHAYSDMIKEEERHRRRLVASNQHALAFTRFASREPFDVRIFPRTHQPFFETTPAPVIKGVAAVLQEVLASMEKKLGDPDYNFFVHSAPLKNQNRYQFYHWHIDIIPRFSTAGGIEIGTGVEVTVIDPDEAAAVLRQ